jgi:hypothetical protein
MYLIFFALDGLASSRKASSTLESSSSSAKIPSFLFYLGPFLPSWIRISKSEFRFRYHRTSLTLYVTTDSKEGQKN